MDISFPLDPAWWNWYLAGIVLMGLEILLPGVFMLWFGAGALLTGLILHVSGGFAWPWQLLLCAALSLLSILAGRRLIRKAGSSPDSTLNRRLNSYLGRQAVLDEPLAHGQGRVKLDGIWWLVKGPDLPSGTIVVVTGAKDSRLILARAET